MGGLATLATIGSIAGTAGTIVSGLSQLTADTSGQDAALKAQQQAQLAEAGRAKRMERGRSLAAAAKSGTTIGSGSITDFLMAQKQATADELAFLKTGQAIEKSELGKSQQAQKMAGLGQVFKGTTGLAGGLTKSFLSK